MSQYASLSNLFAVLLLVGCFTGLFLTVWRFGKGERSPRVSRTIQSACGSAFKFGWPMLGAVLCLGSLNYFTVPTVRELGIYEACGIDDGISLQKEPKVVIVRRISSKDSAAPEFLVLPGKSDSKIGDRASVTLTSSWIQCARIAEWYRVSN